MTEEILAVIFWIETSAATSSSTHLFYLISVTELDIAIIFSAFHISSDLISYLPPLIYKCNLVRAVDGDKLEIKCHARPRK